MNLFTIAILFSGMVGGDSALFVPVSRESGPLVAGSHPGSAGRLDPRQPATITAAARQDDARITTDGLGSPATRSIQKLPPSAEGFQAGAGPARSVVFASEPARLPVRNVLFDVTPSFSIDNAANHGLRYLEPFSQTVLGSPFSGVNVANLSNKIGVEFGLRHTVSETLPAPCDRIAHIVSLVSQAQMFWVDAWRVVACVTNKHSGRDWTDVEFVTDAVRKLHSASSGIGSVPDHSVAIGMPTSLPQDATSVGRFSKESFESFLQRNTKRETVASSRTETWGPAFERRWPNAKLLAAEFANEDRTHRLAGHDRLLSVGYAGESVATTADSPHSTEPRRLRQSDDTPRAVITDQAGNPPPTTMPFGEAIYLSALKSTKDGAVVWDIEPEDRAARAGYFEGGNVVCIPLGAAKNPYTLVVRQYVAKGGTPAVAKIKINIGGTPTPPIPPDPEPPKPPVPPPLSGIAKVAHDEAMKLGDRSKAPAMAQAFRGLVQKIMDGAVADDVQAIGLIKQATNAALGPQADLWKPWGNAVGATLKVRDPNTPGEWAGAVEAIAIGLEAIK